MLNEFYKRHKILSHVVIMICVSVFMLIFAFFFLDIWTNHGRTTVVPEVRKKSYEEATAILDKSHLKYEIADSVYDMSAPAGSVKEMWPHAGTRVKPGRVIYLTVNSFEPQKITISMSLTGVSSRQAISYLESLNIKNIRIVYVPSSFPDLVVGATYNDRAITPGTKLPINATVVLEVGTETQSVREERNAKDQIITTAEDPDDVYDPNAVSTPDESGEEEVVNHDIFD